jgi:hypothetical protein
MLAAVVVNGLKRDVEAVLVAIAKSLCIYSCVSTRPLLGEKRSEEDRKGTVEELRAQWTHRKLTPRLSQV